MESLTTSESVLLKRLTPVFPFLRLKDIIAISNVSTKMLESLHKDPALLIYILKKYYLSDQNPHPKKRKFFKHFLYKIKKENVNYSDEVFKLYMLAVHRLDISKNLIRHPSNMPEGWKPIEIEGASHNRWEYIRDNIGDPTKEASNLIPKDYDQWVIIRNGGEGWKCWETDSPCTNYFFITSFGRCEMIYNVAFDKFSKEFVDLFKSKTAVIKAGCFMSMKFDCPGRGGCNLTISKKDGTVILEKKQGKKSSELPIKIEESVQIIITVQYDEIKDYIADDLVISLRVYGRDEKWWAGNYGSLFYGMYIRGDYEY